MTKGPHTHTHTHSLTFNFLQLTAKDVNFSSSLLVQNVFDKIVPNGEYGRCCACDVHVCRSHVNAWEEEVCVCVCVCLRALAQVSVPQEDSLMEGCSTLNMIRDLPHNITSCVRGMGVWKLVSQCVCVCVCVTGVYVCEHT